MYLATNSNQKFLSITPQGVCSSLEILFPNLIINRINKTKISKIIKEIVEDKINSYYEKLNKKDTNHFQKNTLLNDFVIKNFKSKNGYLNILTNISGIEINFFKKFKKDFLAAIPVSYIEEKQIDFDYLTSSKKYNISKFFMCKMLYKIKYIQNTYMDQTFQINASLSDLERKSIEEKNLSYFFEAIDSYLLHPIPEEIKKNFSYGQISFFLNIRLYYFVGNIVNLRYFSQHGSQERNNTLTQEAYLFEEKAQELMLNLKFKEKELKKYENVKKSLQNLYSYSIERNSVTDDLLDFIIKNLKYIK